MRIAIIAPLEEAIPPKLYGGTERVVSNLTEQLVEDGHQVTLFATSDSKTAAELEASWPRALRLNSTFHSKALPNMLLLNRVIQRAQEFDILHFHGEFYHQILNAQLPVPSVTTIHGSLHPPEMQLFFNTFPNGALISISDNQRLPLPNANWVSTVYHGLPADLLKPVPNAQPTYLAFLGRISPEKRVDRAIRIADAAGLRLKVAAKLDNVDLEYYENRIKSLMTLSHVENIGEIGEHQKAEFLSNAVALIFPIDWEEPFGLVMIEAMACGTPVVAFDRGSVPEVIDDGVTGFIVAGEAQAVEAVNLVASLDRSKIRQVFEERFSAKAMAAGYLKAYEKLINSVDDRPTDQTNTSRTVCLDKLDLANGLSPVGLDALDQSDHPDRLDGRQTV